MPRFTVLLLLLLLVPAAAATAAPVLHAHRGGALTEGVPTTPEDTLEAFREIARTPEVWLEMDTVVSSDGVPFVIHDSTLDRTTTCAGNVVDTPAATIEGCVVDVIGVSADLAQAPAGAPPVRVPRLAEALALAKAAGSPVNLEIKRIPGDAGYVPGDRAFAVAVMAVVKAAGLDPAKLIVQSFDPTNLDVAKEELPGVVTSLLTLAPANEGAPETAAARGYQWVSPGGVPSAAFVARSRALGLRVVPYTLNTVAEVQAAAAAGVDALITDDVPLARRALGLGTGAPGAAGPGPAPAPARARRPRTAATLTVARRSPAAAARRGGLRVVLAARRAARVTLTARLGGRAVGRGIVRLRGAGRRTALLRLTPAGRRALAGRSAATLVLRVAIDGAAPTTRTIRLR